MEKLRVVHNLDISFLKSMSERVGSDIERLWIWMKVSFRIDTRWRHSKFRVVLSRIRLSPTLFSKINWLSSGLPLKFILVFLIRHNEWLVFKFWKLYYMFNTVRIKWVILIKEFLGSSTFRFAHLVLIPQVKPLHESSKLVIFM